MPENEITIEMQQLFAETTAEIVRSSGQHLANFRDDIGGVLFRNLYNSDSAAYFSQNPKKAASFRAYFKLYGEELADYGLTDQTLRLCIRLHIVRAELPREAAGLKYSHLIGLTRVNSAEKRNQLALDAVEEQWTLGRLKAEVELANRGPNQTTKATKPVIHEATPLSADEQQVLVNQGDVDPAVTGNEQTGGAENAGGTVESADENAQQRETLEQASGQMTIPGEQAACVDDGQSTLGASKIVQDAEPSPAQSDAPVVPLMATSQFAAVLADIAQATEDLGEMVQPWRVAACQNMTQIEQKQWSAAITALRKQLEGLYFTGKIVEPVAAAQPESLTESVTSTDPMSASEAAAAPDPEATLGESAAAVQASVSAAELPRRMLPDAKGLGAVKRGPGRRKKEIDRTHLDDDNDNE